MFNLQNHVAIVTGGAAGIGRGIVSALREAGATVVIADLNLEAAQKTAEELGADALLVDVTSRDSVRNLYRDVVKRYGRIDIVCSNAGVFPNCPLEDMTDEQWDAMFAINTHGTFTVVQEALPYMKKAGYGRIVITTSITGSHTGYPGWAHYGASKAAQQGFMRSAALEVARDGITINGVLPGNILTEGLEGQGQEYLDQMARSVPMHRLGSPRDIGNAAAFLASREAGYITGQTIIIDGGQILPESPEAILPPYEA
ncbi:3-oxoacyl-ACP reductase FabG [Corynebacterium aurimucosum]|uniref:3-oxoacyl-ACP reductase FabG n=1 Tax=unclassified Corynebacterium TaxID=2624378 RepID=UPI0008A4FEE5|nr:MULTISPECIES: 3-oxoacyl-ACP reductase FabG [unclassified Corynebacterium]OFL23848.1 3-ketoacyl-ACP reductase [Corynebacterium sp. HMSC062A03]OFS36686.1 3-oxoacyl-[acyl-carrier-protein] reductase [Corynebacterium sp. HMSC069E04]